MDILAVQLQMPGILFLALDLASIPRTESTTHRFVERIALALSASLLIRYGDPDVTDAFVGSRLAGAGSGHFGTSTGRRPVVACRARDAAGHRSGVGRSTSAVVED